MCITCRFATYVYLCHVGVLHPSTVLYFIPFVFMSVFILVSCCFNYYSLTVQFKTRYWDSSSFGLYTQRNFDYYGVSWFCVYFIFFFYFCEECHCFDGDGMKCIDCFGSHRHFLKYWFFQFVNIEISFHFFVFSFISFISVLQF